MNASFKAINPEVLEMQMTISMPLKQWMELRKQIQGESSGAQWPTWKFIEQMDHMIRQAEKHFYPAKEEQP